MPYPKYKHFVFDFDGVISDSYHAAAEAFNEIRSELYPTLPMVTSRNDMAIVYGGPLKSCLDKWLGENQTKSFFNHHSRKMQAVSDTIKPFEGIVSVINTLGRGNMSIVTSSYSEAVLTVLSKDREYDPEIIYKICGRELHQTKTEKIANLLSELKIAATEAVYIGDLESDILYCRDVPIDVIAVGYGYHTSEHLESCKPDYLVRTVYELSELLKTIKR